MEAVLRFRDSGLSAAPSSSCTEPLCKESIKIIGAHMLDFSSSKDVCVLLGVNRSLMNEFYWLPVRVSGGREFVCRLTARLAL